MAVAAIIAVVVAVYIVPSSLYILRVHFSCISIFQIKPYQ